MTELFTYLCNFSVVTSIAIVVAILFRPLLKKGPSFIRSLLWTLVFLRLLVPVSFAEIPFSVPTVFDTEETVTVPKNDEVKENAKEENEVVQQVPSAPPQTPVSGTVTETQKPVSGAVTDTQKPVTPPVADTPAEENVVNPKEEKKTDFLKVLSLVWAAGAVLMLGYMLISNLMLRHKVRGAIVYDSEIRILDKDCSPFVFGFFKPIIYLSASTKKSDWEYIIAHERTHIKRLDHIVKPLAFLALCLYWYNPLVWAAYLLLSKDIEYACDERTVKAMESDEKKAYSLALLSASVEGGRIFAPLSFGKVNVKERIKRVMRFKKSKWAVSITAVICALLFVFIACTPAAENNDTSSEAESSSDAESVELSTESSEADTTELEVLVDYVSEDEADVTPDYVDGKGLEFVKLTVNENVTEFIFFRISTIPSFDGTVEVLYEMDELTPDKPFYVKTNVAEGASNVGVAFKNDKGELLCYRIMYDSKGDLVDAPLYLELITEEVEFFYTVSDVIVIYVYNSDTDDPFDYVKHSIDGEPTGESVVHYCIEAGHFPKGSAMQSFEIKDRVGYLDMNSTCYELSTPYHDYFGMPAVEKSFLANFDIDSLVITCDGKQVIPDPVGEALSLSVEELSIDPHSITPDYADVHYSDESLNIEKILKIQMNQTVTDFKLLHVFNNNSSPYLATVLYELDTLDANKPFYVRRQEFPGIEGKGVYFKDKDGKPVIASINYSSTGFEIIEDRVIFLENTKKGSGEFIVYYYDDEMPTPEDGDRYLGTVYPYKRPEDLKLAAEIIVGICNYNGSQFGSKVLGFEIENRIGYLNLNRESYHPNTWSGTVGLEAMKRSFLETFRNEIDSLVITYDGHSPY